jgi:hypothetical protein
VLTITLFTAPDQLARIPISITLVTLFSLGLGPSPPLAQSHRARRRKLRAAAEVGDIEMGEKDVAAELAALRKRVEELEGRAKPPTPVDLKGGGVRGPTTTELAISRLGMSREVLADHVKAVGGVVVREIVGDGGAAATLKPLGGTNPSPRVADENRSGWRTAQPLSNPPGVAIADRLMDAADKADRVELAQRLARQKLAER